MVQRTMLEGPDGVLVHTQDEGGEEHLLVATREADKWDASTAVFTDVNGNPNLNIDASASGTPDGVHNGTDTVLWTATALTGAWDFASTAQAQQGTQSIDATATVSGDQALLTRSSPVDSGSYSSLSGWVYLTSFDTTKNEVLFQCRLGGVVVGGSVDLGDYITPATLNAWQAFTIPLSAFGVTGNVDELTIQTVRSSGQPPDYYLDTLQLEQSGSVVYTVEPPKGNVFFVNTIKFVLVDALDITLSSNAYNLSYDKILNVPSLVNGLALRYTRRGEVQQAGVFRRLYDFILGSFRIDVLTCDQTNTMLKLINEAPEFLALDSTTNDRLEIIISDDLSGLIEFRGIARGRVLRNGD